MLFTCYLREGVVYVPTVARRKSEPIYTTIEPVAVVPLSSPENVRRALFETIARKNAVIPDRNPMALREPAAIAKICRREKLVRVLSRCVNMEHHRRRRSLRDTPLSQTPQRLLAAGPRAGNPISSRNDDRRCR